MTMMTTMTLKPKCHKAFNYESGPLELPVYARANLDEWTERAKRLLEQIDNGELSQYDAIKNAYEMEKELGDDAGCFLVEERDEDGVVTYVYESDLEDEFYDVEVAILSVSDRYREPEQQIEITAEMCLRARLELMEEDRRIPTSSKGFALRLHHPPIPGRD